MKENFNFVMIGVIPNEEYRGGWLGRTWSFSSVRRVVPDAREVVHHLDYRIQSLAIQNRSRSLIILFDLTKKSRIDYSKKMTH